MARSWKSRIGALALVTLAIASALGQGSNPSMTPVASRVTSAVSDQALVTLKGNTHPLATSANDKGLVDAQLPMRRMQLVLKRSPEQQAALDKLVADQNDPKSSTYHHWLHAAEFGKLFGPSDSDIAVITAWLQSRGFSVDEVSAGRVTIEFSGTAAQVQQAFHTEMHHYVVNSETHLANNSDPQIPQALAPVVVGISSLHDFFSKSQYRLGRTVTKDRITGKITPVTATSSTGSRPEYSFPDPAGGNAPNQDVGPYDFAAIYNLAPLWNSGITGKNVSVAIVGRSNINLADVSTFRTFFGLSTFTGATTVVLNGADPGIVKGDVVENTLDVEWAGASAPDAKVLLVASASTATTGGDTLSESYIINHETAPVMSLSYGQCEAFIGSAGNSAINALYQQAAAEGISTFDSAGDQGSAGCDNSDAAPPTAASYGLAVNGLASSPYVTGVGGTDFVWQDSVSTYWSANNGSNASALRYIPEIPWNSTCTSSYVGSLFTGEANTEQLCNDALNSSNFYTLLNIGGGSGGASSCIGGPTTTGTVTGCTGAYPKPSWQTGPGVPADNARDVPDVSLFASSGLPGGIVASAYLMCVSSNSPDKTCDYTGNNLLAQEVGGTSVSAPAMAGIMALVVQKTGSNQGLANPILYQLAATQNSSTCNSNTVGGTNSCLFYDVTTGTNAMPCIAGKPNCTVNKAGDQAGVLSGYNAGAGYDLATGLGSVNAYNLVNAWPTSNVTTPTVSVSPTSFTFPSTLVNATSTASTPITVTNTGTVALSITSIAFSGTNATAFADTTTCPTGSTLAGGASCAITMTFKPATSGTLTATLTIVDGAGSQTVSVSGVATTATTTITVSPAALSFAPTNVGASASTQTVTLQNTGSGPITFGSPSLTGTYATSFAITANTCGTTLATGASCTVSVGFTPTAAGTLTASLNASDNATGSPQTVSLAGTGVAVVTPTTTTLTTSAASVGTGMNLTLTATVKASGGTPSGTVMFLNGSTSLGTGTLNGSGVATLTTSFATAGAYTLTASYAANGAFGSSTSSPVTETVVAAGVTATIAPSSLTIKSGTSGTLTITVTPSGSYTGTATFSCGTLPQNASCVFVPVSLAITGSGPVTETLTINTQAQTTTMLHAPATNRNGFITAAALWLPGSFLALFGLACRKHIAVSARQLLTIVILSLGLVGLGALSGCGGGSPSSNTPTTSTTTPTGTYTIPVTVSASGAGSQTINASVIVQ